MRKVNAYKLEVLVLDFGNFGLEGIKDTLESAHPAIRICLMDAEFRTINEWSDNHPLNSSNEDTYEDAYETLFPPSNHERKA